MLSTRCIEAALAAVMVLGAASAQAQGRSACLTLDMESPWLTEQEGRTIRGMMVEMTETGPGGIDLAAWLLFTGDGPESPGARAETVYRQTFVCELGAADPLGAGLPAWVMPGGYLCRAACGGGLVQINATAAGIDLWTDGFELTEPPAGACGGGARLSTGTDLARGYTLQMTPSPDDCPSAGGG